MLSNVYRSPFSNLDLVETDLLTYLFSQSNNIPADKPIFIDALTGTSRTYGDIERQTRSLAHGLRNLGVKQHDVVAYFSPNNIDYGICCYAIIGCGAIVSPMNAASTATEIEAMLDTCGARYIIVHSTLMKTASKATERSPGIRIILADGKMDAHGNATAEELATTSPANRLIAISPQEAHSRTAFLCFSSGTTGRSKGVQTSHKNITSNMQQWLKHIPEDWSGSSTTIAFLPFNHIYGLNVFLCLSLFTGSTIVVMSRFDLGLYLSSIQKFKPKTLYTVPPVILLLTKDPRVANYDLKSVTRVLSAAAPLSVELRVEFESRFLRTFGTTVNCFQMWGLTETSPFATGVEARRTDKKHTVGCVAPNMLLRLVDPETMEDVAPKTNGHGEIWCHGPNVTMGYYKNDEATRDGFTTGQDGKTWFRTGDIGTIDDDGYLTIVDRIKEMIKYKGLQVIPSELEGKLLQHPHVQDAAVIGKWIESQATEVPVGFVVLEAGKLGDVGAASMVKDIHAWLLTRVANHKRLRGGIIPVDSIPKSASGKILRRQLKDMLNTMKLDAKL